MSSTLVVLNPTSSRPETLGVRSLGIVEIEAGRHPSGRNIMVGFVGGAAAGFFVGALAYKVHVGVEECEFCALGGLSAAGYGALIGAGVGLAIGGIPVRSWERIHVSPAAQEWLRSKEWPYTGPYSRTTAGAARRDPP